MTGLIGCAMMAAACSTSKSGHELPDNGLTFDSLRIDTTAYLMGDTANPSCHFELKMTYPSASADEQLLLTVQQLFVESYLGKKYAAMTPQAAADAYMKAYVADYRQDEKDYDPSQRMYYQDWAEQSTCSVTFNQGGFVSLAVGYYTYTGGAHGNNGTNNHVIDLNTKSILALTDLFNEADYPDVGKLIIQQIARNYNYTDPAKLSDEGIFNIDDVLPTDNFRVDAEGITWTYNPYEIAAYSVGQIDVTLSWALVKPYLELESPVMSLADAATK
jgi:hypothetical protein